MGALVTGPHPPAPSPCGVKGRAVRRGAWVAASQSPGQSGPPPGAYAGHLSDAGSLRFLLATAAYRGVVYSRSQGVTCLHGGPSDGASIEPVWPTSTGGAARGYVTSEC